jgi:hypothetical protein
VPIQHVCLITYKTKAAVDAAAQRAIDDAYLRLPSIIPGIRSLRVGRDLALLQGNADYAIVAEFDSAEAFQAYSVHRAHTDIIYPVMGPHMASYATAQFASGE